MSRKNPAAPAWHAAVTARLLLGSLAIGAPLGAQDRPGPLVIGTDVDYPPFTAQNPTGGYEGFSFDLASEIAQRIGRPGTKLVIQDFDGVFDALRARNFEMIVTPTNITPDRARRVLFSEGYMDTGLGFLVFQGDELRDVRDLRGKILAVEVGTVSDTWATVNEAWLGFSVQRYQANGEAVSAVINRRAFANLADLPAVTHTADQLGIVTVAYNLPIAGKFGLAFHPDDVELRNEVENALECMKLDGTLAALQEKWFRFPAGEDTATNTVYMGYGHPGYDGHDPESHVPSCS
jgi:polar amino acid transport system substrate-binding protein